VMQWGVLCSDAGAEVLGFSVGNGWISDRIWRTDEIIRIGKISQYYVVQHKCKKKKKNSGLRREEIIIVNNACIICCLSFYI
jgi:formate dehydrogenase assembly factor FdhD